MVRLLSGGPLTRRHARAHAVAIQAAERTAEATVRAEKAAVAEAERAAEARVAADRQAELEAATEAANNQRAAAEALARKCGGRYLYFYVLQVLQVQGTERSKCCRS